MGVFIYERRSQHDDEETAPTTSSSANAADAATAYRRPDAGAEGRDN